jgi:hypothetical protein
MTYHYDHLEGDRANGGIASLVKDCIFCVPVNI